MFAARAAEDIHSLLPSHRMTRWSGLAQGEAPVAPEEESEAIRMLRTTMSRHVGVLRDREGLSEALATIARLSSRSTGRRSATRSWRRNSSPPRRLQARRAAARIIEAIFPSRDPQRESRTFITLDEADAIADRAAAAPVRLDLGVLITDSLAGGKRRAATGVGLALHLNKSPHPVAAVFLSTRM